MGILLDSVSQASLLHAAVVVAIVCSLPLLYRRRKRVSISYLPGPEKSDLFFGNLTDLYFKEAGEPHFQWQEKCGQVFKLHGLLGKEYLMVSDPKAIQHIYMNSRSFVRQKHSRSLLRMLFGPALSIADPDDHKRQRKVMQPAFGAPQLRNLFPVFIRHSQKLVHILKRGIVGDSDRQSLQINVHDYITRATLDLTGDVAFEYQFGALDDKRDELKEVMRKLEAQSLGNNSKSQILVTFIAEHLPDIIINMMPHLSVKKFKYIRQTHETIIAVAAEVMTEKQNLMRKGLEGGKDLMSLLLRANSTEDKHRRMSDEELNAGITIIIFAGYTNTASSLSFTLWELAKNPDTQRRVRDEVLTAKRDVLKSTGTNEIPFSHCEKMPLLNALIKETLRFHPVAFMGARQAVEDEVIPLSKPLKLPDGRSITEIPISKGQNIWINICGYNRLPSIFGENAHEFNIDRWLGNKLDATPGLVGVYSNMMTFGHGPHACIGWKIAIHEMQTLLIELLANFEFRLPKDYKGVRRTGAATMIPTVPGDREAGTRLDLEVCILQDLNAPRE